MKPQQPAALPATHISLSRSLCLGITYLQRLSLSSPLVSEDGGLAVQAQCLRTGCCTCTHEPTLVHSYAVPDHTCACMFRASPTVMQVSIVASHSSTWWHFHALSAAAMHFTPDLMGRSM